MNSEELKSKSTLKLLFRITSFVKPFIWMLFGVIILNTIFSIFAAFSIAVVKPVLDLIFNAGSSSTANHVTQNIKHGFLQSLNDLINGNLQNILFVPGDVYASLLNLSIFIIFIFILKNIFKYWASIVQTKLEEGIIKYIRDKVFHKMTYLSVEFFDKNKEGTLISAITNDVSTVNTSTISAFANALREIIQIFVFIFLLLSISPYLTFIAFSSSIISLVLLKVATKYIRRYAIRMQNAMADYTTAMQETISGIRVVKAYNAEQNAIDKFFSQTKKFVVSAIKHRKVTTMIPSFNEIFAIIALCVVLFVGGTQVLVTKELSSTDLIAFLFYLFAIMSPIALTFDNVSKFQRGFVAAERVFNIIDQEPSVKSGNKTIQHFEKEIEIRNVSFAYQDIGIIKNANFTIKKSKKVAFVGASGSGKSTMLDLIIRFYDPNQGEILIDGVNINEYTLPSYRSLFGIVSQDTTLFNDSVLNNIKYGLDNVNEETIINAAKIANAYDFILQLPDGFNTYVGDRGVMLSGGERQRIAIARALVRNPEIIVFDEATSSLDSESEKIVQDAINKSLVNKTAIIVAHRLATIINCDEIHVFDNGKIVESGTHKELMDKNGIYRKLHDIQFSE
ncbi:ABC transporter ATP-binding protein [Bacteroidetes/Chlorobi group bacterium ChocPot_Mid]|nr:MAG: ABC transporter ATP-binding protein [Bacteroidetes/Chlorobi group bacterium ChocPot_Mid]